MDLRNHLLDLFAPITIGDEVVPGARLVGASAELGLRITVELKDRPVHIEVVPAQAGHSIEKPVTPSVGLNKQA